jgi:RNA polymerase sigma-70 factor (ECF subfamily)
MSRSSANRSILLSVVEGEPTAPRIREVDWSILMARAQGGDAAAYRRLLQDITPFIRSLAAKWCGGHDEVEDAVQDTLLTIHAIRQTYDPVRPFGPWLVAITKRRVVDRLRRSGSRRQRESPLTREHETFPAGPANNSVQAPERRAMGLAIERLPIGQRQAIELLKLREMSLKEAAAATGMSITALKVASHRGLKALRRLLSDGGEMQ